jgi:hypothetical protein
VFFAVTVIATCVGALQTLSVQDANQLNNELAQLRNNVTIEYIFGNNLFICLMMFVPVWGWIQGLWAMYNTGLVLAAESMVGSAQGIPPLVLYFAYWFFPFFWLEFISFSIALSESFWLLVRAIQSLAGEGVSLKRELRNASTLITIVTLTLLVSAIIEMAIIMAIGG